MMKRYIDQLKADTAEVNRQREEAEVRKHRPDCNTPLTDQLTMLWASLAPAQRDRPWSMDEFVARLQGRFSRHPHPMNVGQALRALGWISRRDWTTQGAGRRYWHPPQEL